MNDTILDTTKLKLEKYVLNEPVKNTVLENKKLVFSESEYKRRLDNVKCEMEARNIDVLLINDPANLAYLTGYETTGYDFLQPLVISLLHQPFMITRYLESFNVYARTWLKHNFIFNDTQSPMAVIKEILTELNLNNKTFSYEFSCAFLPNDFHNHIKKISSTINIVDGSGIVERGRVTKSDEEITLMKRVAKITQIAMQAGLDATRVGTTENAISAAVHEAMYLAGGHYPAVAPYITSGPRSLIGHATWEQRTLQTQESVFIEMAGCLSRYHTAMMRSVFIGKPPQSVLDAEKVVLEAIDTALEVMKPGVIIADADNAIRNVTKKIKATGGKMVSRSGYSIGIAFAPSWDEGHIVSINNDNNQPLKENMTLHMIPWVHGIEGKHVMTISETVQITSNGAKSFFSLPRQLYIK
jgi:Xaa-Pro aminopeptidase